MEYHYDEENLKNLRQTYVGKKVVIINMEGEPQYRAKSGIVKSVDDIGQLHGSWGGCAIQPERDDFEIVEG